MGRRKMTLRKIVTISTILQEKRKETYFLILSKMILPSLIASTIVPKRSSVKIISEDSLATSVPRMPIAIPISAPLRAGASFTPSPVIDTISPSSRSALTSWSLFSGETRANTATSSIRSLNASLPAKASISFPVIVLSKSIKPISCAIMEAVCGWSPVIILTRIPASWATLTASLTSVRGGSMMPTKPWISKLSNDSVSSDSDKPPW